MIRLIIGTPRRHTTPSTSSNDATNPPATPHHNKNTNNNHDNDDDDEDDPGSDVTSNPSNPSTQDADIEDKELLEPWIDYIRRATHVAEHTASKLHIEEWTTVYWRRQWRWMHRLAAQSSDRWSLLAALWDPEIHDSRPARRQQARPRKRLDDDVQQFLMGLFPNTTPHWSRLARDAQSWDNMEKA